jgi:hypothetical protein
LNKYVPPKLYSEREYEYRFQWISRGNRVTSYEELNVVFTKEFSLKEHAMFRDIMRHCIAAKADFVEWTTIPSLCTQRPNITSYLSIYACPVELMSYPDWVLEDYYNSPVPTSIRDYIQKELFYRRLNGGSPWIGIIRSRACITLEASKLRKEDLFVGQI